MSSQKEQLPDEQLSAGMDTEEASEQHVPEIQNITDGVDPLAKELEKQLQQALQRERDGMLRAQAEAENTRRRAELDIAKAHKFALEKFSSELLPVIDNLERAIDLADKGNEALVPLIEGIELTLKSLLDVVSKFGITMVADTEVPFNPEVHQAMTLLESTDHKPNHVMMVMQKGYTLNGRLLRPAMVAVSKERE